MKKLRVEKIRIGFGQWAEVWIARCPDGHRTRVIKNWQGPTPKGGSTCRCGLVYPFTSLVPSIVGGVS